MVNIQFIIVGWHFDTFPDLIQGLKSLNEDDESVDVFWSCHREPSQIIKDNFSYKVFPNLGLEDGAYQQALDYLNIDDETILFLIHDDIIVKDWSFINTCLEHLNSGKAFIGNGVNYPLMLNPQEVKRGKRYIDFVKDECKYLFDSEQFTYTLRESFICTTRKHLRDIGEFEVVWEEPQPDENGNYHIGGIGNTQQSLLGYKITKVFGKERIAYLSSTYQDSNYLYECGRGKINE